MKKKLLLPISTVIVLLLSIAGNTFAQSRITGMVTDEQGKPLSHCTVRLMQDGAIIATTVTNGEGNYHLDQLIRGIYLLTFSYGNIKNNIYGVGLSEGEARITFNTCINTVKPEKAQDIALQEIAKRPLINWQYPTSHTLYADDLAHMPGY